MQLEMSGALSSPVKKTKDREGFYLTNRDYEICKFIADMKFASADEIHSKFFAITLFGDPSKSDRAVLRRLKLLENNGYLFSRTYFHQRRKFFFATPSAYRILKSYYPNREIPYPCKTLDIRTFEHDYELLHLRLQLEKDLNIIEWYSDKFLRTDTIIRGGLTESMVPDAIYTLNTGDKIALELEKSQKTKSRYKEKVKTYLNAMRSGSAQAPFSKVQFFCEKESVYKIISEETRIYSKYFEVIRYQRNKSVLNTTSVAG